LASVYTSTRVAGSHKLSCSANSSNSQGAQTAARARSVAAVSCTAMRVAGSSVSAAGNADNKFTPISGALGVSHANA
jgi:hypothetical protein